MNRITISGLLGGLLLVLGVVAIAASSTDLVLPERTNTPAHTPALPVTAAVSTPTMTAGLTVSPAATTTAATVTPSPRPTGVSMAPAAGVFPTETPSPMPAAGAGQVIGQSVQGRDIIAHRSGDGPLKVVLVGNIHGAYEANTHILVQQLMAHFEAHPEQVPPRVSLWFIPTMNPDGLATGHRWNANDVDLNRNADTDLDGCAGNDWSPDTVGREGPHPGAGGPFPFSEPETRAVRDFLKDAWVAVFYHSAAEAIFVDACQRHAPTARLAQALSEGTGYPVPESGWSGYPITGDMADFLAGEGAAAVTIELTDHEDPEFERNLAGVRALLSSVDEILSAEATAAGTEQIWLDERNTGLWRYAPGSFVHPLALEVLGDTAYLLDGGRVLALELGQPAEPRLILAPGDAVETVPVLEPLDLASDGATLLALDRAGDVYRYDPAAQDWTVERYDRPSRNSYDHYFVALSASEDAGYLLETSHEQVLRFESGQRGEASIQLALSRDVDPSAIGDSVYVLTRALNAPTGNLYLFANGHRVSGFQPGLEIMHPRQVLATEAAVYVLDRAGRRVLTLDLESGTLLAVHQFSDRREVSALWADSTGKRLLLAGQDAGQGALHFYGDPQRSASIEGGPVLEGPQPHDLRLLEGQRGLQMPILGARITSRDFQMPGAPRHYRLGVHEGIDVYGHTAGVGVDRSTEVRAVAGGTVVRALTEYEPLTAAQAGAWAARSQSLGYTPPEVLDGYRGMQVWIDHGDDMVSRYAHLGSIAQGIVEGAPVTRGQVIGTVGNSGTPGSVQSQTYDVHLHFELWVDGHYIGQFLRPIEAREWLERILR